MFQTMDRMNIKGKVLNVSFAVSASFAFGDHLGFVAGIAPDLIGSLSNSVGENIERM